MILLISRHLLRALQASIVTSRHQPARDQRGVIARLWWLIRLAVRRNGRRYGDIEPVSAHDHHLSPTSMAAVFTAAGNHRVEDLGRIPPGTGGRALPLAVDEHRVVGRAKLGEQIVAMRTPKRISRRAG
jgi:hypothetical protein